MSVRFERPEYGLCRTLNHAWRLEGQLRKQGMTVILTLKCHVCTTQRVDTIWLQNGEIIARNYYHPDGYLLKGVGEDRPTKQEFRRVFIRELSKDRTNVVRINDVETARHELSLQMARRRRRQRRGVG